MKISFVIVDLNVLDILAIDIGNAYLNATCCWKVYFRSGAEFVNWKYANVSVFRDLYRLKYIGASQRAHYTDTTMDMYFVPLEEDTDVWILKGTE